MKRVFIFMTCVTIHLLNYVVKANHFKDARNVVLNSSKSKSNGRTHSTLTTPYS